MKEAFEHKNVLLTENIPREPLLSSPVAYDSRDVRALGNLSVFIIRIILVSAKACFIPTVEAAPPPKEPSRPPPMKAKDLPLYETPHFSYKDHLDQKHTKCYEKKILHSLLLPYVSKYRIEACKLFCRAKTEVLGVYNNVTKKIETKARETRAYCRCPAHEKERKGIMVAAPILGGIFARGGKPTRLFGATAAALAAGALCYPEPTDEVFKTVVAAVAKKAVVLFNYACSSGLFFKKTVCPADYPEMPPPPAKPMDNKCGQKN